MLKRDWTTCSKYANHYKFNGQHDGQDLYGHLPLIVMTGGARAATHTHSMESIEITFKIPKLSIKYTFEEINVTIQYAMSKILDKRRIENNEPLPINTQLP